jgi:hypothetical protein
MADKINGWLRPRERADGMAWLLTKVRLTCCATTMRSSATTFESRCETWASAKFSLHRGPLGSERTSSP